eukprot:TRINITY_DN5786_c0_g1_i2.p1 TRINITY_DN5786_c0_g1~~TRINITY_DN5786_c0_g1_i2.p1  ORF type:complete len:315 (-),score=59.01 TRINITY_DN5786_c0_g1_i2:88-1032(-)
MCIRDRLATTARVHPTVPMEEAPSVTLADSGGAMLLDWEVERCYGVDPAHVLAWRAAISTVAVTLELPDGTRDDVEVPIDVPVGGLQLALHLDRADIPPPMATALQFANEDIDPKGTLSEQGVMDGSIVQLHIKDDAPVKVLLGTRDGERQVDLWPHEPLGIALARAMRVQLKTAELPTDQYFKAVAQDEPDSAAAEEDADAEGAHPGEAPDDAEGQLAGEPPGTVELALQDTVGDGKCVLQLSQTVAQCGLQVGERLLPGLNVGQRWVPLQRLHPRMSLDPVGVCGPASGTQNYEPCDPVSYTHLTLPTKRIV